MKLLLGRQRIRNKWKCRNITPSDLRALGELMLGAYRGTVDDEGETLDDAISEVQGTINGKYGPFLQECSFLVEEDGRATAACMVTWWAPMDSPLLAFSMTLPGYKNRGIATFLLREAVNALIDAGYKELRLIVTETNIPARHLYEKLGFVEIHQVDE
ncbi:MAG: GNAT family N-acetyltransferase [Promethearchaeati archaeon SRVP18_Atabeyarchaeia-1]